MQLFDEKGVPVDVPEAEVKDAILSGKFGLPAGTPVPIQKDNGTITSVPIEDAAKEFHYGANVVSHEALAQADNERKYGSVGQIAQTAVEGGLRGATLGASDAVAGAVLGDEYRAEAKARKEANPWTAGGSELAGTLAPALLTGGASEGASAGLGVADAAGEAGMFGKSLRTAGKVLAAPTEAVSQVGQTFERGVQAIVGSEGTSLGTRMLQDAASLGARSAAETAAYAGGQELSEQSLEGDGSLNGQKILAAAGHGALLGGLGGGALGAGGELASNLVGRAARKLDGLAETQATKSLFAPGEKKGIDAIGKAISDEGVTEIKNVEKVAGRYLLDNQIVEAGSTIESQLPKAQAAVQAEGSKVSALLDKADATGLTGPNVVDVFKPLEKLDTKAAKGLLADIAQQAGVTDLEATTLTFKQAQDLRTVLDEHIGVASEAKASAITDALRDARKGLNTEVETSLRKASPDLGDEYAKATQDLAIAKAATKVLTSQVETRAAARGGLSPVTQAAAAGLLGSHGGPLGALSAVGSSLAHHYLREHGSSTAAVALDKLSQLQAVRRAALKVDRDVDRGVARIAEKAKEKAGLHDLDGTYQEKRELVAKAAANAPQHAAMIDNAGASLEPHAPDAAGAFKSAAMRALAYLTAAMPVHPTRDGLLPSDKKAQEPPADQQATFVRKFDAVDDPTSILNHVHEGTLTADEVAAVKAVHPELLQQMRTKVREELQSMDAKKADAMPQEKKQAISTFLGQPIDKSTSPAFVTGVQAGYTATPPSPQTEKPMGAPKRKLDVLGAAKRPSY